MKRLIIHLGTHKTASTAIQFLLARNRQLLLEEGFFYPTPPQPPYFAQHAIAWEVARWHNPGELRPVTYTLADALADFRDSGAETLVLSSEDFLRPTFAEGFLTEFFRTVRPTFDHITVAAYVRNRKGFFTSSYNQWVKSLRYDGDIDHYLTTVLRNGEASIHYTRALQSWARWADTSLFLPFGPGPDGQSLEHRLLTGMGIPRRAVDSFMEPTLDTANASLGPHAILAFTCLNTHLKAQRWFRAEELQKRGQVQREAIAMAKEKGWGRTRLRFFSPERLSAVRQRFEREDRDFARTYFSTDWHDLFPQDLKPDRVNELTLETLDSPQRAEIDDFVAHMQAYAEEIYRG